MSLDRLSGRPSASHHTPYRQPPESNQPFAATPRSSLYRFDLCAATANHFIWAQHNILLSVHRDSLTVHRRFEKHAGDILLLEVDNVSERGHARFVVSYDSVHTAIVWDLYTGGELSRFTVQEHVSVISWLCNSRIAFGNARGQLVIFDPWTSEHVSSRTIGDPLNALAPAADCQVFALGYENGSILIANPFPSFEILHVLPLSRHPLPVIGLAWHGSSSRQDSEMLASQTRGGELKVWSIKKESCGTPPRIIRQLYGAENPKHAKAWFAWSKNGRLAQHSGDETRVWDVRTKKVAYVAIPTVDDVIAITNHGPTGTMFTMSKPHVVQQYDIDPDRLPMLVKSAQHVPTTAPLTPPESVVEQIAPRGTHAIPLEGRLPIQLEAESSEDDAASSINSIDDHARALDEERRDRVGPLSPGSSRGSLSSASSHRAVPSRNRPARDRSIPSRTSDRSAASVETLFSDGSSLHSGRDGSSVRSSPALLVPRNQFTSLQHVTLRSPEEDSQMSSMELFHFLKTRLHEVPFRSPHYISATLTPEVLSKEMLRVVFGWDGDAASLVRDEQSRHKLGSPSSVLLSKWLGEAGVTHVAPPLGSGSMTSSDWMLLALSCQIHQGSQKQIGEAFVRRMLETGDVHPAVALLLGLGDECRAIEVYASRGFFTEAILLTCLVAPEDWSRQSSLVRRLGETAISQGLPNLAVRCFSCTSPESGNPWSMSTDSIDHPDISISQSNHVGGLRIEAPKTDSSPLRTTTKTAALKLITTFRDNGKPALPPKDTHITPIIESALSPSVERQWQTRDKQCSREPSSARTLTPGRNRQPSSEATPRDRRERLLLRVDLKPVLPAKTSESLGGNRADSAPAARRYEVAKCTLQPSVFDASGKRLQGQGVGQRDSAAAAVLTPATALLRESKPLVPSPSSRTHRRSKSAMPVGTPTSPRSRRKEQENMLFEAGTAKIRYDNLDRQLGSARLTHAKVLFANTQNDGVDVGYEALEDESVPRGRPISRALGDDTSSLTTPLSASAGLQASDTPEGFRDPVLTMVTEQGSPFATNHKSNRNVLRSALSDQNDHNNISGSGLRMFTKKELAAKELEDRRLSLARRPSAPTIPHPQDLSGARPRLLARATTNTDIDSGHHAIPRCASPAGSERSRATKARNTPKSSPMVSMTGPSSGKVGLPAAPGVFRYPKHMNSSWPVRSKTAAPAETPSDLFEGNWQRSPVENGSVEVLTSLPSTVYVPGLAPTRSASAPLEYAAANGPKSHVPLAHRSSADRIEESSNVITHTNPSDATVADVSRIVVAPEMADDSVAEPILLPQLQHLAGPPPPPPLLPTNPHSARSSLAGSINSSGIISIALDSSPTMRAAEVHIASPATPASDSRSTHISPSRSPSLRRRSFVAAGADSISSKWRTVAGRIRSPSSSRGTAATAAAAAATRTKSPPVGVEPFMSSPLAGGSPYETVIPGLSSTSTAASGDLAWSPPAPAAHAKDGPWGRAMDQTKALSHSRSGSVRGASVYRSPREIRANIPPDELQTGVLRYAV